MAKGKGSKKDPLVITVGEGQNVADAMGEVLGKKIDKQFEITSATIKNQLCIYSYDILTGISKGDEVTGRKGSKIIHEDMTNAFEKLHAHLAYIDGAFKNGLEVTVEDIDTMHASPETMSFKVNGFDIVEPGEEMIVVLRGKKTVDFGVMGCTSPQISLGMTYPFADELKVAILDCVNEVELYMAGKAAPVMVQTEMDLPEDENNIE